MPVSEPLREYAVTKMARLNRYLDRVSSVEIILSAEHTRESTARNLAQAVATVKGRTIRAECSHADMYAAIDGLVDKLHMQLTRFKERTRGHTRRGRIDEPDTSDASAEDREPNVDPEEGDVAANRIVEVRQLSLKPMFPDEAIEEMNESGQTFYVFLSAQTEKVSVLYRRADGQYGLVESAFA
jgi:putative sigma-54 modulation protein